MKRFLYGVTTVTITSGFFTLVMEEKAWMAQLFGISWYAQFLIEIGIGTAATLIGCRIKEKDQSEGS